MIHLYKLRNQKKPSKIFEKILLKFKIRSFFYDDFVGLTQGPVTKSPDQNWSQSEKP